MRRGIVVTGGAGFIGSHLVRHFCEKGGYDIFVVDRLGTDEKWRNLAKREIAGLVAPEEVFDLLKRERGSIESIIHMGAISSTTETDADLVYRTNVALSLGLLEYAAEEKIRFIYASSAATYGDGMAGFDDDGSPSALAQLRPLNVYGWSKHLFDRIVARRQAASAPMPPQCVGLKFFNVYGPNETHKGGMRSVVAQIFPRAHAGETVTLFRSHNPAFPDGGQRRDFIYVKDCANVVGWLFDHPGVSGLFNLGTGESRTFLDLARAVFSSLQRTSNIRYVDTPEAIREKYQYFTEAKMERLRGAGYTAQFTTLEDGVADYIQNYLATEDPYA